MNLSRMTVAAFAAATSLAVGGASAATAATAAVPIAAEQQICSDVFAGVYAPPSSEPLAQCQWDMALIHADQATHARATGAGVRVGILDSGVDINHPDIAPNLDLAASCSFVRSDDPTITAGLTDPVEAGNGDCSNKAAVQDLGGHGTHVASTVAAPINGVGIAGVAPDATIVALKACTASTYCYGYAVADALRYAGDHDIDVVNMSLFADPYLFYCGNDAGQRALMRELQSAARYAQQHGVLLVASAGNESLDLKHPIEDTISPDGPQDTPITRSVGNNCRVLPGELPGVLSVMATGPVGYPGYTTNIADYSSIGGDLAAPGGDYFAASGTVQDAILAAMPANSSIFAGLDPLNAAFAGLTTADGAASYAWINGTSMAAPHVTGVAALVTQLHPGWSPSAVAAAVKRTAAPMACPPDWQPLSEDDERVTCQGGATGHTSFFGAGMVDAAAATAG
ncbi:MAG TPA: S8 family serine peptidase [Baekduia sp.]|nr:S8 family serine peptidase [Baekduia sp.]